LSQSFVALRHAGFRPFLAGGVLAMMADNVEHVITYWVIFQHFKSPALGGFAVIAHWLPFLLFSVPVGALGERFDPRRLIQCGMLLFIVVSLVWGVLILTNTLQLWHAAALLIAHGIAGVLWTTPAQLLLHDIVGRDGLQSAVRLNATGRYLGMFLGPAVGSGLLLALGPAYALLCNALIYLPFTLWLWKAPFNPRARYTAAMRGLADIVAAVRAIAHNRTIVSMTLLAGGASLFVGNAYQAQMPEFAHDLGHGHADIAYSMLLAADAAGSLIAGIVLESRGLLRAKPKTAFILAMLWCCAIGGFAASTSYPLAFGLLLVAGFVQLSFSSMAQTLVQINAPADMRGRVIGLFSMAGLGMRAFSGITVGVLGGMIGVHWSLALSALGLLAIVCGLALFTLRSAPAR